MVLEFDDLHQAVFREDPRNHQAVFFIGGDVLGVDLIAVAVPLRDMVLLIGLIGEGRAFDLAGIGSQAHGTAKIHHWNLIL
jgi:hypothetical protein